MDKDDIKNNKENYEINSYMDKYDDCHLNKMMKK